MNASDVIVAGGIAPVSASVEASDRLDALAFTHPALPGRTVVRLVPERVGDGARTELGLCGFVASEVETGVGRVRRRALGFPARAIAEDPANARYALAVMKEFNAAKKRVATKPGHARDAFVEVADKLGRGAPHFLPSFWEEAGRAFITHGAVAMAGTCFEKARTAEREHGLSVDEDARADAFVEFALAGALAVKSILAWPAELKRSAGPEVAYDRLFELAVRRTLGGRAPWASLPKDLREYAKAAKRDPAVEEARFVRAVLGAVAMRRAPLAFWQTVAKSVAPLAAEPAIGDRIARFFPELSDAEDQAGWIALLRDWGILDRIARDGVEGGMAAWVGRALAAWDDAPELHAVVLQMVPRLLAERAPVPVMTDDNWSYTSVDTYEALLAAGVDVEVKDEDKWFALDSWAARDGEKGDPVRVAAHPKLGVILENSVQRELGDEAFQRVAVGKKAFEKARREHLAEWVGKAGAGGMPDFEEALEQLESNIPASTRAEFPAEAAPIPSLTAATALARTLAGAVPDELGWAVFDAAYAELQGAQGADVTVTWLAPYAVLCDGRRAIVVGPGGREGEYDLKLPKKARNLRFRFAGGQLLVGWQDPEDWQIIQGYWSGDPRNVVELEWAYDRESCYPPRDGGVLAGRRILRPNDTSVPTGEPFCDAEGVWATDDDGVLHAVNLATGKLGPVDAPAFLTARDGAAANLGESTYLTSPVADSPLGGTEQYGWASFDLGDLDGDAWVARNAPKALRLPIERGKVTWLGMHIDGRAVAANRRVDAMIRWPGHADPILAVSSGWRSLSLAAVDGATLAALEAESAWSRGSAQVLPLALWHHLRPRDPDASARLRAVDLALAEKLLAAAAGVDDDDDEARAAFLPKLREILPITDDRLANGVAGIVIYAAGLQSRLDTWRANADEEVDTGASDSDLREALQGLTQGWGRGENSVVRALTTAGAFLRGQDVAVAESNLPWREWMDSPGALIFRAIAPATTAEERALIEPAARALVEAFAGLSVRHLEIEAPRTASWIRWVKEYGERTIQDNFTVVEGARRIVANDEDDEDAGVARFDVIEVGDGPPLAGTVLRTRPLGDPSVVAWLGRTLPVGDEVYAAISAPTGLSRGEAALVWAGLKGTYRWNNDPLGKEGREKMGVKLPEVKAARELLAGLDLDKVWRAYHEALLAAASPEALPAALGQSWATVFGARVAIDEALLAAARVDIPGGEAAVLAEIGGAPGSAKYTKDLRWKIAGDGVAREGDDDVEGFEADVLERAIGAIHWIYANTSGEHPLRDAVAATVGLLRERVAAPGFVFEVVHSSEKPLPAWYKRFDGAPFVPTDIDPETEAEERPTGKDRGGVVATAEADETVRVAVRPARLSASDIEEIGKLVVLEDNWAEVGPWNAFLRLRDPVFGRIVADRTPGWGQDPRRSAPDVVAKARARGLSEEAAVAWLQLLALPNPTRANTIAWNGWKPAQYAKAVAELLEAGLVVEGKRARAGRDVFLPGGWHERRSGSLPLEEWKLALFGGESPPFGSILPLQPFGELFAAAWARVEAGKGPRYEKVK